MKPDEKEFTSEGLTQVWAWKDSIQREVAHLPLRDALRSIQQQARAVVLKHPELRHKESTKASL